MDAKAKIDVSPISFASQEDPPVMQVQGDKDDIVPPQHARKLHEQLKRDDPKYGTVYGVGEISRQIFIGKVQINGNICG